MNKLVICSFEGALIDEGDAISYKTMLEVDRIRKEGSILCVVSSKDLEFIMEYNKDFPFLDYIIAYDGGCVYDVSKGKIILKKHISVATTKKIVKLFKKYKIVIYTSEKICDIRENNFSDVVKIDIICSDLGQIKEIINGLSNIGVNLNWSIDSNQLIVSVIAGNASREKGVSFIIKVLGVAKDEVFLIGSKAEDKNNVKKYSGVVVNNADIVTKDVAKYISEREDSNGVYELLASFW